MELLLFVFVIGIKYNIYNVRKNEKKDVKKTLTFEKSRNIICLTRCGKQLSKINLKKLKKSVDIEKCL